MIAWKMYRTITIQPLPPTCLQSFAGEWITQHSRSLVLWLVCLQGKYTAFNGDVYEGDWVNDEKTGKGRQTFRVVASTTKTTNRREGGEHGHVEEWYEGDWLGGKMHGKGDSLRASWVCHNAVTLRPRQRGLFGIDKQGSWTPICLTVIQSTL